MKHVFFLIQFIQSDKNILSNFWWFNIELID